MMLLRPEVRRGIRQRLVVVARGSDDEQGPGGQNWCRDGRARARKGEIRAVLRTQGA